MSGLRISSTHRDMATLWTAGKLGAADDMDLIDRFLEGDELSETAFRILVERHGAMVFCVCRRVLGDGHDARDAAQAVFLVLARKAGTIRRGSVAAWLHGVAFRVAAKARRRIGTRRNAEARTFAAVAKGETVASSAADPFDSDVIHEEVARLPEKYRAPVVLCYLEGLTYEEAARRIGCPVGTIRIRLSRARDRLRERLARKGFGPAAAAPATVDWLEAILARQSVSLPAGWVDATLRSTQAFLSGTAGAAGAVSSSTLILTQGVLRSMLLTKLNFVACGILGLGLLTAGGSVIVGQEKGNAGESQPAKSEETARRSNDDAGIKKTLEDKAAAVEKTRRLTAQRSLVEKIRNRALERVNSSKAFYEEGKITIDRFLDSLKEMRDADALFAETPEQTKAAFALYQDWVSEMLKREKSELEVGRGTIADVAEVEAALERANYDVLQAGEGEGRGHELSLVRLERRITAIETKLDEILAALGKKGGDTAR